MNYDDIFKYVGHTGRIQWLIYAIMFVLNMFCMEFLNMIFVGGEMEHWCRVDALSELTPERQRYIAIPSADASNDVITEDVTRYSSCHMFDVDWTTYGVEELAKWNRSEWMKSSNASVIRCTAWNYDQSIFTSTIVSSFNLVCGREMLTEFAITINMIGLLVGTVTSGLISDRFGRRKSLLAFLILKTIGSAIAIFSGSYASFMIGRFVGAVGTCGCFLCSFVIVMELFGPNYRTVVGAGMQLAYSLGFMMSPSLAYFLRDEFTLQLATMGPAILFIPFVIWMPESPRWLVVESKYEEGRQVLLRICKANGTELPEEMDLTQIATQDSSTVKKRGCSALLRSPTMCLRTAIMHFSWFTSALVYCALSMFSTHQNVSSSLYVSTLINGAIEIPVNAAAIWIIDWKPLGRRRTGCISLVGAGVTSFACAISILYDYSVSAMVMSLLGKAFITLAYSVVYVYGSEIFPTEVRNVGIGSASMFECFGGIVAPLIAIPFKRLWLPMPSIVYGIIASLSGLSYIYLPETLGQPLPDTIEQADKMAADQKQRKKKGFLPDDSKALNGNSDPSATSLPAAATNGRIDGKDADSSYTDEKSILRRNEMNDNEPSNEEIV